MPTRWRIAQYLELHWWRRYLHNTTPAAYKVWKTGYWRNFLKITDISVYDGAKILDAGCGPAGIFMVLENCSVLAIDLLIDVYEKSLDHFQASDYPWVSFRSIKLESLEPDPRFDMVFCLNAINHVDVLSAALDRLVAALKPGGQMILSVDVHRQKWLRFVFQCIPGDVLHPHQHMLDDYLLMLSSRGISIETTRLLKRIPVFDYYVIVCRKLPGDGHIAFK